VKAEEYSERRLEVEGWEVNLTSYRIGAVFHCHADNVSPGANIARTRGESRQEAEEKALERARQHLSNTRRRAV
jgi:hypothetical protein